MTTDQKKWTLDVSQELMDFNGSPVLNIEPVSWQTIAEVLGAAGGENLMKLVKANAEKTKPLTLKDVLLRYVSLAIDMGSDDEERFIAYEVGRLIGKAEDGKASFTDKQFQVLKKLTFSNKAMVNGKEKPVFAFIAVSEQAKEMLDAATPIN